MGQRGFYFDMTRCSGCKCCQVACKETKNLDVGVYFRQVHDYEGGTFPAVWAASLSLGCNHCAEPQCLVNCPVAAINKDKETGLVLQDRTMCIGCERCIAVCPYKAPAYLPDLMVVGKCDGCKQFLELDEQPACVGACSTRALGFGDLEELREQYGSGLTSDLSVLPDSSKTTPSLLIKPKQEML